MQVLQVFVLEQDVGMSGCLHTVEQDNDPLVFSCSGGYRSYSDEAGCESDAALHIQRDSLNVLEVRNIWQAVTEHNRSQHPRCHVHVNQTCIQKPLKAS